MAEERKIELTVERVGNKLVFQFDPQIVVRPGCCCCCNYQFDAAALGTIVSEKLQGKA